MVKRGEDTWFFVTADYAFGMALERDAADVVKESGGKVVGDVRHGSTPRTSPRSCSRRRPPRPR